MKKIIFILILLSCPSLLGSETKTLKSFLNEAIDHSPYLQLEKRNIHVKDADVQIAWAAFMPHLQGEAGRVRQSKENYYTQLQKKRFADTGNVALMSVDTDTPQDSAFWNVTAKQDIFKGFGNYHNLKEKKKSQAMEEIEYNIQKNNLIYDVTDAYIQILNLQNNLNFLSKAKSSAEEQRRNLQKKYDIQAVQKSDLEKAEEKYLELDWKELEAKQAFEMTQNKLNQLLGEPLNVSLNLAPIQVKKLNVNPLKDYLTNIPKNFELMKLETEIEKDKFEKRKTYGQHLMMPNVGFEYNYEQRGEKFTDLQDSWKFGISARVPFFDGLENFGEQYKAQSQLEGAQIKAQLTRQAIEIDIKKHFYSFQALDKNIEYLKKKRDREQNLFNQTRKALAQQAATLAQLHATEVIVLETETKLLEHKRQQLLNFITLQKLTGDIHYEELF